MTPGTGGGLGRDKSPAHVLGISLRVAVASGTVVSSLGDPTRTWPGLAVGGGAASHVEGTYVFGIKTYFYDTRKVCDPNQTDVICK